MQKTYDFLIVGGGIFGITTAVELAKRKYSVGLINPDTIPHHLAASTDISKAVRMEYGSDQEYFQMAEESIKRWLAWNDFFDTTLYHEVGFLMLCKGSMESESQSYERESYENLKAFGYATNKLDRAALQKRFPVVNSQHYHEANFNPKGGYVESGLAVHKLAAYAQSLGVDIHEGQTAKDIKIEGGKLKSIKTKEGETFSCGHAIIAAGANTPYLLQELQPYIKSTGHAVFWLKPDYPIHFTPPRFSVFTADISNTGWYGFPFSPKTGVIKIGKHSSGRYVHPDKDDRMVTETEVEELRFFLQNTFPDLAHAALVYTRRCLYTDTLDGHFWIDRHPYIEGLSVSTGGSGHGFKMGPLIGEMTADTAEGREHHFAARYRWRHLKEDTVQNEEARHLGD
jgi:glycine/D-amino acid oxidase-like deaminating enzyme